MSKSHVAELKTRVLEAEARVAYLEACLECFWTGDIPDKASFEQMILASWGRKRLEEKRKTAALLQKDVV
jgi:hypothetical protein